MIAPVGWGGFAGPAFRSARFISNVGAPKSSRHRYAPVVARVKRRVWQAFSPGKPLGTWTALIEDFVQNSPWAGSEWSRLKGWFPTVNEHCRSRPYALLANAPRRTPGAWVEDRRPRQRRPCASR